jgi:hypothetical protein
MQGTTTLVLLRRRLAGRIVNTTVPTPGGVRRRCCHVVVGRSPLPPAAGRCSRSVDHVTIVSTYRYSSSWLARTYPMKRKSSAPAVAASLPDKADNQPQNNNAPLDSLEAPPPPSTTTSQQQQLANELQEIGFSIFQTSRSLGYFTWRPDNDNGGEKIRYQNLDTINDRDVTDRLDMNGRPPTLDIPKISLPYSFDFNNSSTSSEPSFDNKFPYGQLECVHLHAATLRETDWKATDFSISGSALHMLAERRITPTSPFFCCKIPHTGGTILVAMGKEYAMVDGETTAYQFERLVTGKSTTADDSAGTFTEHLQLMKVGTFHALFRAKVGARSAETGQPIEITTSKPRYRGTRLMLQMISSGSTLLCEGSKSRGSIVDITTRSLVSVANDAIGDRAHLQWLENNIVQGLSDIQTQLQGATDGHVHKIVFAQYTHQLKLEPLQTAGKSLLPRGKVMKALLTNSTSPVTSW